MQKTQTNKFRLGSFEAKIDSLLPDGDSFEVRFFELLPESEGGWSVNDSWRAQRDGDRESTIYLLRHRWEVFKANYLPRARVSDITDIQWEGDDCNLEVDCTAFAEVRLLKESEGGEK